MVDRQKWRGRKQFLVVVVAGLMTAGLALGPAARAADLDKLDTSLKWMPADAGFYVTFLRNREQIEAIANSRAWAKLKSLPAVQMGLQMLQAQVQNPQVAPVLALMQQPENQQLISVLGDMFSHEVFIYGGQNMADFLTLANAITNAQRYGPALAQLSGQGQGLEANKLQAYALLKALANNAERLKFPNQVIGYKLSKTEPALAQLKRLEDFLNAIAQQVPPLQGRFQRQKIGEGSFLTLSLDGSLVPWDQIPLKDLEQKAGEFDDLVKKLRQMKLTISLGIRGNYLLLATAESSDVLKKLGSGPRLIDRPEFKPLADHADKPLTAISYASQALLAQTATSTSDIDSLLLMANTFLEKAEVPAEQREKIRKELTDMARGVKTILPQMGAMLGFSYQTSRGGEGYTYDWTQHPQLDASKPLTLLDHVGGSPLLAVVGRSRYSPETYQTLVTWLKKGNQYFEELALPRLPPEQKEQYERVAKIVHPLLQRLDQVTGTMLLPALADGQSAIVLDGKLASKQWHQALPATAKPMPMFEPALVLGVTDPAKLRKAVSEYRSILNEAMAKLHELAPEKIPDFQIPPPETRTVKSGTIYAYPLAALGVDSRIAPNAGLSDKVAVLSIAPEHTERLLATRPLALDGGPLADSKRPLARAVIFNCAGIMTTLSPWIEFGVQFALQRQLGENADSKEGQDHIKTILDQVRTGLEVLKVFRGYSSITYFEGNVLVTHGETVIKDL